MPEPVFYTVEEAAAVLRVGRTTAYRLVKLYVTSAGAEGIPAILIGGQYRVPRVRLEELAGGAVHASDPTATDDVAAVVPLHSA
jgi:excisionase family DNA binding protein